MTTLARLLGKSTWRACPKGQLAALLTLTACSGAPGATSEHTARAQFAEEAYCPVRRVRAHLIEGALPPPDVAADPERLALWKQAATRRIQRQLEWLVQVEGCGERANFICADDDSEWAPKKRCVESAGAGPFSSRAVGAASQASRTTR